LEFSFDRSRDSSARRPDSQTQSQSQNNSQQSAAPRPGPDLNTVDPSTVANDRLRKAIERNRAKQAERDAGRPVQSSPQAEQQQGSFFAQSSHLSQDDQAHIAQQEALREAHRQANMEAMRVREQQKQAEYAAYAQQAQQAANTEREEHRQQMRQEAKQQRPSQMPPEAPSATETQSPRARLRARMAGAAKVAEVNGTINNENIDTTPIPSKGTSVVSRRSVGKPEDTEFVPVKRTPKKVASQISYTTTSTRKKQKSMDPKYVNWLVKGSWIFCGLMVLRLIFATGGVTDFYSQKGAVADRLNELGDIKKENMQLVREIERMRTDVGFQKKLVRDNLGFIASDEFLVLFPK
jgi:cell division protein FtsB